MIDDAAGRGQGDKLPLHQVQVMRILRKTCFQKERAS